ncbi:MAG: hypothetical protein AB1631_23560 [Acidobacteriota bacterium]
MSVFHDLQDIYFDAQNLRAELERIPPHCDCGDADAHLSGRCCCSTSERPESEGCISHLERLRGKLEWFREDLRREGKELGSERLSDGAEGRLSLIISLVDDLNLSLERIEADLDEFRKSCAHKSLERVRERGSELARHIAELNRLL